MDTETLMDRIGAKKTWCKAHTDYEISAVTYRGERVRGFDGQLYSTRKRAQLAADAMNARNPKREARVEAIKREAGWSWSMPL